MQACTVYWASDYQEAGNAYGYTRMMQSLRTHVSPFVQVDKDSKVAITLVSADRFKPVPGKYNILFTMFEAYSLPQAYIDAAQAADEIVVPCSFCKDLFKRHFPGKKISVCRLGVDPEKFPFKERSYKPGFGKFRILWIGAPNPRKGYATMLSLMDVLSKYSDVEIYLKTTTAKVDYDELKKKLTDEDYKKEMANLRKKERLIDIAGGKVKNLYDHYEVLGPHKNVHFDCRNMTEQELLDLYYSAHIFVFPSVGEGWGLTLTEAMATGVPVVSPVHTGIAEFFDNSVGWSIGHTRKLANFEQYDLDAEVCIPNGNDTLIQTMRVRNNYELAKRKARSASQRIRQKFTWSLAGKRLADIITDANKSAKQLAGV